MGIILTLILAAFIGWLASKVMGTDEQQGAVGNVVAGIVGAVIAGFLARVIGFPEARVDRFEFVPLFFAFLGACLVIWLYQKLLNNRNTG